MPITLKHHTALIVSILLFTAEKAYTKVIPDLTGLPLSQAETELLRMGLTAIFEPESSPLPRNSVLRHIPASGGSTGEGGMVLLWVSDGLKLPNVIGQSPDAARAMLEQMGATVQFTTRDSTIVIQNTVLEVVGMKAGDTFDATLDAITLVIPKELGVKVPSLVGSEQELREALAAFSLKLTYLSESHQRPPVTGSPCEGWVSSNTRTIRPAVGTIVKRGTTVEVKDVAGWEYVWVGGPSCGAIR
jgi:serine/threonine-protein kinase